MNLKADNISDHMRLTCRVGVVGVGHLGRHHARIYGQLPGSTLVGVYDIDQERSVTVSQEYGGTACTDLDDLLARVEAVSVAVPTSSHFPIVKRCLEAGVHVLVEKPIAATSREGWELEELAANRGLVLQVGHIERFNPVWDGIRASISQPHFVQAQRLSPYPHRGTDVDVVRDLMVHDLDILLSLGLGNARVMDSVGMCVRSGSIDLAHARLQFDGGGTALLTASRVSLRKVRTLWLLQDDACIEVDYQTRRSILHHRQIDNGIHSATPAIENQGSEEEPLRRELEAFLEAVTQGSRSPITGADASRCLELAEQVLAVIKRAANAATLPLPTATVFTPQ